MAITCSRPVKNRINMYTKISINLLEEEKFNNLQINDRTRVLHTSYYWVCITWLKHNYLSRRSLKSVFNPSILFSFLALSVHWNFWSRRLLKFCQKPFHSSLTSLVHSFTIITVLKSPIFSAWTKNRSCYANRSLLLKKKKALTWTKVLSSYQQITVSSMFS